MGRLRRGSRDVRALAAVVAEAYYSQVGVERHEYGHEDRERDQVCAPRSQSSQSIQSSVNQGGRPLIALLTRFLLPPSF